MVKNTPHKTSLTGSAVDQRQPAGLGVKDPKKEPFGTRLRAAMDQYGPLCVGIDPHSSLLTQWGLTDDIAGLREFCFTVLDAVGGQVAAIKPQVAFFERFGSPGVAALEDVVRYARELNTICILDAKRGDIGSTMAGYASAFLQEGSPLAGDAVTLSPYLGFGSLQPAIDMAIDNGRGVFVLCLTSNPEGATVQHAINSQIGQSVAAQIAADATKINQRFLANRRSVATPDLASWQRVETVGPLTIRPKRSERWSMDTPWPSVPDLNSSRGPLTRREPSDIGDPLAQTESVGTGSYSASGAAALGPVGLVVGATIGDSVEVTGTDLSELNGPILAPGVGAQGAGADELKAVFGDARQFVIASSSREILSAGPSKTDLLAGAQKAAHQAAQALRD